MLKTIHGIGVIDLNRFDLSNLWVTMLIDIHLLVDGPR